jgi:hypothetical protein
MYNNRKKETRKEPPISRTKKVSRQQLNQRKTIESKDKKRPLGNPRGYREHERRP